MKALIIVASALFAFSAFAGEYSKPVSVLFQSASTYVPAEKVCRDGNVLKHKTKAAITVSYCDDNDANCTYVSKALTQPVVSTAKRCAQYASDECVAWETYTLNQASVNIMSYNDDDVATGVVGKFTIPACKTGGGVAN